MSDKLPPGWAWATMSDVAEVQLGRQRSPRHHAGDQMRPYLRSANVTWSGIDLADVKEMNFDDADFEKYRLRAGDLLLNEASGSPNEVGKPAIWRGEIDGCCFQNTLLRLQTHELDRGYVYWYCQLSARSSRFGDAGRGVNIRHLGKQGLARFPIPIAPGAEQKRVVAAIEEHSSRLDAAEATLRQSLRRLDTLRSSILTDAFHTHRELPEGWQRMTISQVADVQLGRQRSPQHHSGEQMRPYLRAANVSWDGLALDDVKTMNFDDTDFEKYRLKSGDLLLNEASGSPNEVGKPAIWDGQIEDCCFQNTLLRLRPRAVRLRYLYWYCYRSALSGEFGEAGRGVNIRHLGKQGLARFPIPVAPPETQDGVVARIDQRIQGVEESRGILRSALDRVAALRRSVLTTAFSGRLVPQGPDDEPASVLLERIAASRPATPVRHTRTA